ncbi:MAG: sodium:proton exchanger [Akkermansiaceae bacterium]|nr:sodium:proton exchanger [Akkermansiaceae bacterium]
MTPLTYLALVLALGILAQWLAWRLKVPSILLLLAFGFGLSALTNVTIDDYMAQDTLLAIVGIFVSIILFEGGLTLKFSELREAGRPVLRICTLGVFFAFLTGTLFLKFIFGWDWRVAALVGAILVVTGPTVIGPLLRVIKPVRKISSIVKWEGIVVDPIGAILAVLVYQMAVAGGLEAAQATLFLALGKTVLVGVVLAVVIAKIIELLLKHHLVPDFLESVFLLAVVASAFAVSNHIQSESGLLTVTVLGIALANQKSVSVRHILEFKEHLRVLIISLLFILLSGRISLGDLKDVLIPSLLTLAALILLVRPASVFLAFLLSKRTVFRERLFIAALAPRGIVAAAVTSIFAIEFEHAAHTGKLPDAIAVQAKETVPVVFLIIIGTVLFYGLLAAPLARALGLAARNSTGVLFAGADEWIRTLAKALAAHGHAVLLLDTKYEKIAAARLDGIPAMRINILSEYAEEELDFSGIGQLVTATPNDEVNSLAAREFTHIFGRANVWQIAPQDSTEHHTKSVASHRRGRICFTDDANFIKLQGLRRRGAVIKKTQITDVFTLDDLHLTHGEEAVILFLQDNDKGLRPAPADLQDVPVDTTIYAYVIPDEPAAGSETDDDVPRGG